LQEDRRTGDTAAPLPAIAIVAGIAAAPRFMPPPPPVAII
jgi:hypothetical protein